MGKHFWSRHTDDEVPEKEPRCGVWGLLHILDFNRWQSNVRKKKMIRHHKFEDDEPLQGDLSSKSEMFPSEVQTLLEENDNPHNKRKKPRKSNKHSIRERIKALLAEAKERDKLEGKESFPSKTSSLQRTYSIHHLESLDWIHPVILFPKDVETEQDEANSETSDEAQPVDTKGDSDDILDLFKVDKVLFMKHLQENDEKSKFSKSTSFPLLQVRKFKSSKLENKHKEVWTYGKERKVEQVDDVKEESHMIRHHQKRTHRRSSSLNESMEKYSRLLEDSYGAENSTLHPSRSLKVANERGHGQMSFKRIRSVSNVDSYYSDLNVWVVDNDFSATEIFSSSYFSKEKDNRVVTLNEDKGYVPHEATPTVECQNDPSDCINTMEYNTTLEPTNLGDEDVQDIEGLEHKFSNSTEEEHSNFKNLSEIFTSLTHEEKKIFDLHYMKHLLDQSGIASSEMTWQTSDQPLGPQLFEEIESYWPHQEDELTGQPDFHGCWHHMMLFHLINEALLEVYEISFPYYPKPLSYSCRIRPFPVGEHIVEEVSAKTGKILDMKLEEESLESITAYNLMNDSSWMNLQFESECVGLDIEELIFQELLEELLCS